VKIDIHNHAIPQSALDLLASDPVYRVQVGKDRVSGGNHVDFPLFPSFVDPAFKLGELERKGLDAAVISAAPPLFFYDVELDAGEAICKATNEGMAEFCRHAPDRLRWMAHVPMRSPERAAQVLEQQVQAGCCGVEVATSIAGRRLDESEYEVFWAVAERLNMPVMIHPAFNEPHAALRSFYLQNVIGNMLETTLTAERLICARVLERHPGLRVVLVHSGGFFPYQAGRLYHARQVRPELKDTPPDPWSFIGQLVFDTITHDRESLRYLIARVGVDNVFMGTDLPFDMAPEAPMQELLDAVDSETVHRIAEENPARLYGFGA
jgi:aminocarboxymuconate-semialdehyde decarboxylase